MSLGISGRIAAAFQNSAITPLLALIGLLLGAFAIVVTPKEEEPQIDVTFANVFIGFPGASAREVEQMVAIPAEQVLSEMAGVDDVFSISQPGQAVLTVAFEVGIPRQQAIVNLYNQVHSHRDWFPPSLGVMQPVVKPMGIDDVPIMSLTLWSADNDISGADLTKVAHTLEDELKRVTGTRDIYTLGQQTSLIDVELDPARMNGHGLAFDDVRRALQSANVGGQLQSTVRNNQIIRVQAGDFLQTADEVGALIVGKTNQGLVYLRDVAQIAQRADTPNQQVQFVQPGSHSQPAVTVAIAKQPGTNAIDITTAIRQRLTQLQGTLIPDAVNVEVTRDYGQTAKTKSDQLMAKLLFATAAVVVLVLATMSWREAVIVGGAIFITLAITLFASWVWGFTLNRVSLFALIFSIGILVDDAIVVVENIHRHMHLGGQKLLEIIPQAVDEVGGPTILATFTVIAALMPMAFVSGLMGPYMSPIPINASTGMLISLIIAFVVTPWLSYALLRRQFERDKATPKNSNAASAHEQEMDGRVYAFFNRLMRPFIDSGRRRWLLFAAVTAVIGLAVALPAAKLVVMKMLPFDNKSEFQVVVDMPEGTPMEQTLAVLEALSAELSKVPEVKDIQLYAGASAPINFNGLVRQYYLRSLPHQGDLQVNLVDKSQRDRQSHDIALSVRPALHAIGKRYQANVKVVEVPPGPPVMAPIVAEVYGTDYQRQIDAAKRLRAVFENTAGIVDVDDWVEGDQPLLRISVDRQRAAQLGIAQATIVQAINTALGGEDVSYLHNGQSKYPLPIRVGFGDGDRASLDALLSMKVRAAGGQFVALGDLISVHQEQVEKNIYRKNLQPVVFVTGDMVGDLDSPLYGLYDITLNLEEAGLNWPQFFIRQPPMPFDTAIKWDGEWQITYETFRDMGIAYAIGMILIYLLVVAQFRSYLVPLIIMAPIPLTVIGVMPGHALFGAQFTATSMIGMIALAGIIVRNSILLVDFINQKHQEGMAFKDAIVTSAAVRARPIVLTGVAAMVGAFFILDDPIFNGLAISLIFGILISTALTLVIIPLLYYSAMHKRMTPAA
ncbi:multidrug transporter AcrB [Bacterioplanes sanyensis]|uniref:efflux RND transporter permease subunit n=1 Tax=Bacterioplanes sanyensis TaxID=1249553 RepID=UPI00167C26E8|nr:efflux RND transporter permease subunit [Bacterioplanes sanyensis]GGY34911.1 multidrug transporter AcrB [Bacterioplanes sanyensis]